jgi:hypothetical protein
MSMVQQAMLPGSPRSDLAQVFLGGLVRRLGDDQVGTDPYGFDFDFDDGIREELLAAGRRSDTARVVGLTSDYLGAEVPAMRDLRAALVDPDRVAVPDFSVAGDPFVQVQQKVMTALAGPYAARARRLRRVDLELVHESAAASSMPPDTSLPSVWGGVPPRNINFTGREDLLRELRARFERDSTATAHPEALYGLAGVGKTQIAIEYAYRHAADYDLVWWLTATDSARIRASLRDLAARLGLPDDDPTRGTAAVLDALRVGRPARRWLLVVDNTDDPGDVRPFIPAGPGHILVTTRNSQWSSIARPLEVDVFTRPESRQLLLRR